MGASRIPGLWSTRCKDGCLEESLSRVSPFSLAVSMSPVAEADHRRRRNTHLISPVVRPDTRPTARHATEAPIP